MTGAPARRAFAKAALPSLAAAAFAVLASSGCTGETSWRSREFEKRDLSREAVADVELPAELWDKLDQIGREGGGGHEAKAEGGEHGAKPAGGAHGGGSGGEHGGATASRATEFASVKVYLYPKAPGTLAVGPTVLEFGEGGGEVDFSEFVADRRGTFYVAIEPGEEFKDEPFKAYFLSNAKEERIGAVRHGAGCRAYYDVTSFFKRAMKGPGILVSSADMRHAFALGGTLFLGYVKGGALKVTQITFRDARAPEAECRGRR